MFASAMMSESLGVEVTSAAGVALVEGTTSIRNWQHEK
jgi:hypothetical protein